MDSVDLHQFSEPALSHNTRLTAVTPSVVGAQDLLSHFVEGTDDSVLNT